MSKLKNDLTNSETYYKNVFSIPLFCDLSIKDQNKVIKIINNYTKIFSK